MWTQDIVFYLIVDREILPIYEFELAANTNLILTMTQLVLFIFSKMTRNKELFTSIYYCKIHFFQSIKLDFNSGYNLFEKLPYVQFKRYRFRFNQLNANLLEQKKHSYHQHLKQNTRMLSFNDFVLGKASIINM